LANNPGEILPGLVVIVESANRYGFSVDKVLAQFSREMVRFEQFMDPINIDRLYRLRYQISMYLLDRGQYNQGVETILQSLQLAIRLNGAGSIIDCVTLFETYRHFATEQQQKKYGETLRELRKNEENTVNGIQRSGII
jgi:hypothetical protein